MVVASEVVADPKVDAVRAQLPAVLTTGYLNAGTNGPLPTLAIDELVRSAQGELERGRIASDVYLAQQHDWKRLRACLAEFLHADATEIALTRSTTEGMNISLMGLDWRRGDEVITTNLEHPGLTAPLALAAHRYGITIRVADIGHGGGDVVGAIEAAITGRTRAIALSHLHWSSGAVMPLQEIARRARRSGILTFVDAAQAAGQIPVDLHDLGVDAYAMSGQKWLCGPGGTGALYVRRDRFADIRPTYIRYAQVDPTGFLLPPADASRYEMGEVYNPATRAQEATLRWLIDVVGLDWLFARVAALGRRCWDGLSRIERVTVTTPRDRMAGIVCFRAQGLPPKMLSSALAERGLTIRAVEMAPGPVVARVSNSWWNTEDEVDGLVAAVGEIVAGANG